MSDTLFEIWSVQADDTTHLLHAGFRAVSAKHAAREVGKISIDAHRLEVLDPKTAKTMKFERDNGKWSEI